MNLIVGITCVGGHFAYDLIQCFRNQDDFNVCIVGFDSNPKATGRFFCDEFQVIPSAKTDSKGFIARVLESCKENSVDIFIPSSEDECKAVSENIDIFNENSISTSIGNTSIVSVMTDKFSFLNFLSKNGINVGSFYLINSLNDVVESLKSLGYPNKNAVLKPRNGSGSRGILIINSQMDALREIIPERLCAEGGFDSIIRYAKHKGIDFSSYMIMEYYPGNIYDVDCVARDGKAINVVPRLRQYDNPLSPYSEGCKLTKNKGVILYVERIISLLECHGACDFDIAMNLNGEPRVIDASTRLSGSVAASIHVGINIPAQLLRIIKGMPTKNYNFIDEIYVRPARSFIKVNNCIK